MDAFFYILFCFLALLFGLQFVLGLILSIRMPVYLPDQNEKKITSVSVIIPFRNERSRILPLLESLNGQNIAHKNIEFIFVDDSSDDSTDEVIQAHLKIPYSLIRLDQKSGKKAAIHTGIEKARLTNEQDKSAFILTLDADVELPEKYIDALFQLPESDMIILPVKMVGDKMIQRLSAVEFGWLQLLTFGAIKPALCNGANLLFRRTSYLNTYQTRSDFDLVSGDDIFLLHAFQQSNQKINRVHTDELTVKTPAPIHTTELLKQRRRWIDKLSRMHDKSSYLTITFLLAVETGFLFLLTTAYFNPPCFLLIALKIVTEFMIAINIRQSTLSKIFITTLIHQVWYPVYLIQLMLPVKKDERWGNYQK